MNLRKFIIKRFLHSIFVIFGLSILIFIIARIVPGDPARMMLGPRATAQAVELQREEMHLNDPLVVQYAYWIKGVFSGNFGRSFVSKRPVLEDIKEYFPATLELVIFASILMVIFAILFGTLSAQHKDTWLDNSIRILSYLGVSIPAFVAAIFFLLMFGYHWQILPVIGRLSPGTMPPVKITGLLTVDSLIQGNFKVFWDSLKHLILPSVAVSLGRIAQNARITRSTMIDNMNKDFIASIRGFGIPEKIIMSKYLLKPSVIPTVTMMGIDFGLAFANAFLVEKIFIWPGLSRYGIDAMMYKDLNAISAVIIIYGLIFIIMNIIVDIITGFLDPRARLSAERGR